MCRGTTEGSAIATATGGTTHTVVAAGEVDLVVVVRDLVGAPLEGATVTFTIDGRPAGCPRTSDPTGLCEARLRAGASIGVSAELAGFTAASAVAAPLTPGATTLYATVRLARPYVARRLFAWQNAVLREALYKVGENDEEDRGHAGDEEEEAEVKDRALRLRDFITKLGSEILAPAPAPPDDPEVVRLRAIDARLVELEDDEDSRARDRSIRAEEDAAGVRPAGGRPRGRNQDAAIRAAREGIAGLIRERAASRDATAVAGMTHTQLMERVLAVFDADVAGALAPWVRYMVVHFSGLRYVNANQSFFPAEWAVRNLRYAQIGERRDDGHDPDTIESAPYAEPELESADDARLEKYLGEALWCSSAVGLGMPLERSTSAALTSALAGGDREHRLAAARNAHRELVRRWALQMTADDAMALLVYRRDRHEIPDDLWDLLCKVTLLRIEQTTTWTDLLNRGAPNGVVASQRHPRLFSPGYQSEWHEYVVDTRIPTPWGAQCNQIAEIAMAARGGRNRVGLTGTAMGGAFAARGTTSADPALPRVFGRCRVRRDPPPAGSTEMPTPSDNHRLWRPDGLDELEQGDVFLKMTWARIGETRDRPSNWVYTTTTMRFLTPTYQSGRDESGGERDVVQHWIAEDDRPPAVARRRAHPTAVVEPRRFSDGQLRSYRNAHHGADPPGLRLDYTSPGTSTGGIVSIDNPDGLQTAPPSELETGDVVLEAAAISEATLPLFKRVVCAMQGDRPDHSLQPAGMVHGHAVVRRHPRSRKYHEMLLWSHEGTVIATKGSTLFTFETCGPTGVYASQRPGWNMVFGRVPATPQPDLTPFLARANLLGSHLDE